MYNDQTQEIKTYSPAVSIQHPWCVVTCETELEKFKIIEKKQREWIQGNKRFLQSKTHEINQYAEKLKDEKVKLTNEQNKNKQLDNASILAMKDEIIKAINANKQNTSQLKGELVKSINEHKQSTDKIKSDLVTLNNKNVQAINTARNENKKSFQEFKKILENDVSKTQNEVINNVQIINEITVSNLEENPQEDLVIAQKAVAYTDGSVCERSNVYSYGSVIIMESDVYKLSGIGMTQESNHKPLLAECLGILETLRNINRIGVSEIVIYCDNQQIINWINAEVDGNKCEYIKEWFMKEYLKFNHIMIKFEKVKAHSGNAFNEEADRLARQALSLTIRNEHIEEE